MESLNFASILKILGDFGTLGLVIFLWWQDNKRIWIVIESDRQKMKDILEQYSRDMAEQRKMYENNSSLCRDFAGIARDLRDIVTLNIQKMTEVGDAVKANQFCPLVRMDKQKVHKLSQIQEES